MSAISTILARLRSAIWAIDVRDDIADAIEQCYSDVSNPTLQTDALEAAIQEKIDEGEMAALTIGDGTITAAKLAANAVTTPKIADGSITQAKLDPNIDFVQVDDTLSQTGEAADAAAVGAAIDELNGSLETLEDNVLNPTVKSALLNCIADMVCHDEFTGNTHYHALFKALYGADKVEIGNVYIGTLNTTTSGLSYTKWTSAATRMVTSPVGLLSQEGEEYSMYVPEGYRGIIGFMGTDVDVSSVDFTLARDNANKTFYSGTSTVDASQWTEGVIKRICPADAKIVYFYLSRKDNGKPTQTDTETLRDKLVITKKSA